MIKVNDKILVDSELWTALEATGDPLSVGAAARLRELHNDLSSVHTSLSERLAASEAALAKAKAALEDEMGIVAALQQELDEPDPCQETCSLLAAAVARAEKAEAWKAEAMAVEAEWDAQAIAKMLGGRLGASCRAVIAEKVPQLISDRDAALARVREVEGERNHTMAAAMRSAANIDNAIAAARAEAVKQAFEWMYDRCRVDEPFGFKVSAEAEAARFLAQAGKEPR